MKEEVGGYARAYSVILIGCALAVFILYFSSVLAIQTIQGTTGAGTLFFGNVSLLEDRDMILNISLNNTDFNQTGGVNNVTIELPSGLVYKTGTQNVSTNFNNTFSNTTTALNWSNESEFLVNGSVSGNASAIVGYFWFNVSATNPGQYNVVIRTFNKTGQANYGNLTVNVNDTTNGTARFLYPLNNTGTASSAFNYSGNFTDNFNLSRVTLYIWNSTTLITPNGTSQVINSTAVNNSDVLANFTFTFPREDRYFFNFLVNDTANNSAFNATNFSIVYDATRPLLEFNETGGTSVVLANVTRNWTFVNVTVTETNEVNITFTLYNSTALVNSTAFSTAVRTINWTDLRDDWYQYNVTLVDLANNRNESTTRNITIDTTRPLVIFNDSTGGPSEVPYANVSRNWTFVNVTVTEVNQANITFALYYANGTSVNVTTFTSATRTINWTNLSDGGYAYNVTVTDYVNFINITTTRNITIDTTRPLAEFNETGGTSVQNSNVSRNWTFVNATVTETNEANITFALYYTNGTSVNVTTFANTSVRTINWTNLGDGRYAYNVTVTDYANSRNTTTSRNITIDTTRPLIVFNDSTGGPTAADYTNTTRTWVFVNATVTETNEANITFALYNGSGNSVNVTTFTDARRVINWTGLSDGNYTYNVTITDYANSRNTTARRTIFIDTTGPTVSVAKTSSTKTSLTLTITATDAVSGVNTPCTSNRGTVSGSTITESSLACSTSYAYDVTCNDFAGNSKVGSLSATTDSCAGGESGGGGGGGGGGSTTTASTWTSTFVPEAAVVAQGYTRELVANERVKVTVSGQEHHVGIASVSASSVTVEIASTPRNVTLAVGETKKVDVTNDTTYDLAVTLHSISSGKANLTITSISEKMPESPATSTGAATQEQPSSASTTETSEAESVVEGERAASGRAGKATTWVIVVIVVLAFVIWLLWRRKR